MITNTCTVFPVQKNGELLGMVYKENIMELILVKQAQHTWPD